MSKVNIMDLTTYREHTHLMQMDKFSYFVYKDELYVTTDDLIDEYQIECYRFEEDQIRSVLIPRDTTVTPVVIKNINYEKVREY